MASYPDFVLADAPTVYYKLDEASGTSIVDQIAAHNGTLTGTVTYNQPGPIKAVSRTTSNRAIKFDGSTAFVDIPAAIDVTAYSALSVEFWMYIPDLSLLNHDARVVANSHTDADNKGLQIHIAANGTGGGFALGNGTGNTTVFESGVNFQANTWYHIVCTWSGSAMKWYINLALNPSNGTFTGPIAASGFDLNIGRNPAYTGDYFPGIISQVAIYNTALSQSQIAVHYHAANYFRITRATPTDMMQWNKQYVFGNTATFNGEIETYLPANVSVSGDHLVLEARNTGGGDPATGFSGKYTSGMVTSRGIVTLKYGYIEGLIQFPGGLGVWPAFWMLYLNVALSNEIDINEIFESGTVLHQGLHFPTSGSDGSSTTVSDVTTDYHLFAVEWTSSYVKWYFDGALTLTISVTSELPVEYMYVLLNVAISGVAVGGDIPLDAQFPIDMNIKYVDFWQATDPSLNDSYVGTEAPQPVNTSSAILV